MATRIEWWLDGACFVIAMLLAAALAKFLFEQWVMEAAEKWRKGRELACVGTEYDDDPLPAPWANRYGIKPWYVNLADRWTAQRRARV